MYGLSHSPGSLRKCWSFEWGWCYKIRWVTSKMNSFRETSEAIIYHKCIHLFSPWFAASGSVYMQLQNFLILPKTHSRRGCSEAFIHNQDGLTSAQPDSALAHVCAMYFCLPALGFLYGCHELCFVVTFVNLRNCGNSWLRCKCLINGRWNPHG